LQKRLKTGCADCGDLQENSGYTLQDNSERKNAVYKEGAYISGSSV
jgi:hypothetical protein